MSERLSLSLWGFPGGTSGKEPACQCRRFRRPGFDPWVRKIPWRRKWQPTPVSLPGNFHGQRSLEGYSPWGCKESDMTEYTCAREKKKVKEKVTQSCPTLCDPMDYTVHGMLQVRILEWVAFPFSRGSSQPRDPTQSPALQEDS